MAAVELKYDNVLCYATDKRNISAKLHREIECHRFKLLDLFYYLTSVSFFFIDIATDNIVVMEYFLQGQFVWGYFALSFTILPAGVIQMFSLRWYHSDGSIRSIHWLLHFLFLGVLHRYLVLLCATIYSLRRKRFAKDKNWVYRQESDICMLHLFESFMGAAPQLILQLYIMAVLHRAPLWTSLSAVVSFCSLSWAIGTYTKAMHKINPDRNDAAWVVLTLQGLWRAGMLISRIAVLVLTAICLREWSLLFVGIHWLSMTVWVILQNTDFCPTVWEERIYNCIIGLIYCFDFFNLRVGKSRYRVLVFYAIVVTENIVFLIVYVLYFRDVIRAEEITIVTGLVIGGMMVGLSSMLFYYGKFHPSKSAGTEGREGGEARSEIAASNPVTATPRSFKQRRGNALSSSARTVDHSPAAVSDEIGTDKQFLLTSIVQSADSTAEHGIVNQSFRAESEPQTAVCIVSEHESAHNGPAQAETAQPAGDECADPMDAEGNASAMNGTRKRRKRSRGIVHGSHAEKEVPLALQKRRAICFPSQLVLEMEKDSEGKGSTESPSLGDVPKDGNGVADTEKLGKDLQQKDETMSCVTSIHDYENVCPLGVARPPWCIRSWKGYTDIETYIHDDSVVRDRRRDTLTSTTTGTTYSSDFSDTTCTSSILRGILKQDDYLDTLTYDLLEPRDSKAAYSVEDASAKPENSTLYIAKPVVIDDKGGMFALDTIVEEHDDASVEEKFDYPRPIRDSVSTLVSTIDQIRRYTAENSPRHVYHTTGSQWEDFDPKDPIKTGQLTKALFGDEARDAGRNRIDPPRDESGPIVRAACEIDALKGLVKYCGMESIGTTPLIDAILSDSPVLGGKGKRVGPARPKENENLYVEMSPLVSLPDGKLARNHFAQGVSPRAPPRPTPKARSGQTERTELAGEKRRKAINYPRRKFSLLKEKFESKSQLVYVVTPNDVARIEQPSVSPPPVDAARRKSFDRVRQDKENMAPVLSLKPPIRGKHASPDRARAIPAENLPAMDEKEKPLCDSDLNLRERRHVFLEQVLASPKLFTWNKRKPFAGSAVEKV